MKHTVVIGGGMSGLTAAWWLHRAGARVTVFEREDLPGGTIRTVRDGEWLIETGPNSSLETTPLFNRMFGELGILDRQVYPAAAGERRYIVRNGHLILCRWVRGHSSQAGSGVHAANSGC
jgi:oxygen-dependent protoporphyrinogen oxidase